MRYNHLVTRNSKVGHVHRQFGDQSSFPATFFANGFLLLVVEPLNTCVYCMATFSHMSFDTSRPHSPTVLLQRPVFSALHRPNSPLLLAPGVRSPVLAPYASLSIPPSRVPFTGIHEADLHVIDMSGMRRGGVDKVRETLHAQLQSAASGSASVSFRDAYIHDEGTVMFCSSAVPQCAIRYQDP